MYGHPKELIEKMNTACLSVQMTLENIPSIVERMEQKRKIHDMFAQVILDTRQLEMQQQLILDRFKQNRELLGEVSQGMDSNLAIAKQNIDLLLKR